MLMLVDANAASLGSEFKFFPPSLLGFPHG